MSTQEQTGGMATEPPGDLEADLVTQARARASALLGDGPGGSLARAHETSDVYRELAGFLTSALIAARRAGQPDDASWDWVMELHRLLCRVTREQVLARLGTWERVHAALQRLNELGPVSELIHRSATEAGLAAELERVVLSRVDEGHVIAESCYIHGDVERAEATLATLREEPVRIDYPLLEGEMLRRRRSLLVNEADGQSHVRTAHASVMDWRDFVAAPIVLEGHVIGFFHGDRRSSDRPLTGLDQASLGLFADGFAQVFERAVLRRRLRAQRQEIRKIASWADARTSELGDRAINLAAGLESDEPTPGHMRPAILPDGGSGDLLTRREVDVLRQMAKGKTNADIAQALVISEGTVKFHVKNILRKMQVSNRSEATAKYLRMRLGDGGPDRGPSI